MSKTPIISSKCKCLSLIKIYPKTIYFLKINNNIYNKLSSSLYLSNINKPIKTFLSNKYCINK